MADNEEGKTVSSSHSAKSFREATGEKDNTLVVFKNNSTMLFQVEEHGVVVLEYLKRMIAFACGLSERFGIERAYNDLYCASNHYSKTCMRST